jgi:hypothetical protein
VLDPSEYPGFDEDEGGLMANVDAEVRHGAVRLEEAAWEVAVAGDSGLSRN